MKVKIVFSFPDVVNNDEYQRLLNHAFTSGWVNPNPSDNESFKDGLRFAIRTIVNEFLHPKEKNHVEVRD